MQKRFFSWSTNILPNKSTKSSQSKKKKSSQSKDTNFARGTMAQYVNYKKETIRTEEL